MNIDLARRFVLEYLPKDAQAPVNEVFNVMKENPVMILNNGILFNQMEYFKGDNKTQAVAAANGFLSGFALAYCLKFPDIERMLQGYVDAASKSRGENVINFLSKKGR